MPAGVQQVYALQGAKGSPQGVCYVMEELITERGIWADKESYYGAIVQTIIRVGGQVSLLRRSVS